MTLYRLDERQMSEALATPEAAMNIHWAFDYTRWYVIVGSLAALCLDENLVSDFDGYMTLPFVRPEEVFLDRVKSFNIWLNSKSFAPALTFWAPGGGGAGGFTYPPLGGPPPLAPPTGYGHCVFQTVTSTDSVFYRYEHWPVSRRIDRSKNTIAKDTFAVPESEVAMMPSGFAAVARCALPSLLPAIFKYELQPAPGSSISCGAAVPLFGQAGGGVEVKFNHLSLNRCPMADPVYISPL